MTRQSEKLRVSAGSMAAKGFEPWTPRWMTCLTDCGLNER